jgi:hypothetical protein
MEAALSIPAARIIRYNRLGNNAMALFKTALEKQIAARGSGMLVGRALGRRAHGRNQSYGEEIDRRKFQGTV